MLRPLLVLALVAALGAPARAFETPGLDRAVATYRLEPVEQLERQLASRATAYQRGEILAAKALIRSSMQDSAEAKRLALAAVEALKASLADGENPVACHFLLFKLYGQLASLDWTYALRTREPLAALQRLAPQDRRTRIALAMSALFTPPLFGGNPPRALEALLALHAEGGAPEGFDPEVANLLVLAYERNGKPTQARALAAEILQRNPDDRSARQVLERLR